MDYYSLLPEAVFAPCRSTSITSISNPLQARSTACASCSRSCLSAEAASDVAEVDILTDKLPPPSYRYHYILPSVFGDIDGREQSMRQKQ